MDYSTFVTRLQTMAADTSTDLTSMIPAAIDYAELRIYRDLNLVGTRQRDATKTCIAGLRTVVVPTGRFVTVTGVNIVTPVSAGADTGTRNPCTPVSTDYLDMMWPVATGSGVPSYFAMSGVQDATSKLPTGEITLLLGPWPDQNYAVEIVGTARPTPLSASQTTTVLTLYFPDLFLTAAMIFISAYMRNFGAQADDPKMAQSWEGQYQSLLGSAATEEGRKRMMAVA